MFFALVNAGLLVQRAQFDGLKVRNVERMPPSLLGSHADCFNFGDTTPVSSDCSDVTLIGIQMLMKCYLEHRE